MTPRRCSIGSERELNEPESSNFHRIWGFWIVASGHTGQRERGDYLQPVATHVPLQHVGGGKAGQAQMLPPWLVALKSFWYCDCELALIEAFGQKHFELQASPSQTAMQSVSALHEVT